MAVSCMLATRDRLGLASFGKGDEAMRGCSKEFQSPDWLSPLPRPKVDFSFSGNMSFGNFPFVKAGFRRVNVTCSDAMTTGMMT